jgi:hypothetical protein
MQINTPQVSEHRPVFTRLHIDAMSADKLAASSSDIRLAARSSHTNPANFSSASKASIYISASTHTGCQRGQNAATCEFRLSHCLFCIIVVSMKAADDEEDINLCCPGV